MAKSVPPEKKIDRAGLKLALQDLKSVLWPYTLVLCTVALAVALGPAVGTLVAAGEVSWSSEGLMQALSLVGTAIQGTIGVAAMIAGAAVTILLARLALQLAQNTLEIAKAEERREADRYARDIKLELIRYSREFNGALAALVGAVSLVSFRIHAKEIFMARFLVREELLRNSGGIREVIEEHERHEGYFEGEARLVLETLDDAVAQHGAQCEAESLPDEARQEHYLGVANNFRHRLAANKGAASSFSEVIGITPELSVMKKQLSDAMERFRSVLADIDSHGYVSDLVASNSATEAAFLWWTGCLEGMMKAITDDDEFLDRIGRSLLSAELGLNGVTWGSGDDAPDLLRGYTLAIMSAFFSQPTYPDPANVFQEAFPITLAAKHLGELATTLCAGKEQLATLFSLGIALEGMETPRPLQNYRPSETLQATAGALRWLSGVLSSAEDQFKSRADVLSANPVQRYDECLDFWKSVIQQEMFNRPCYV